MDILDRLTGPLAIEQLEVGRVLRLIHTGHLPHLRPPRGRPDSQQEDDLRAVHRRVQYSDDPNASVQNALEAMRRALHEDIAALGDRLDASLAEQTDALRRHVTGRAEEEKRTHGAALQATQVALQAAIEGALVQTTQAVHSVGKGLTSREMDDVRRRLEHATDEAGTLRRQLAKSQSDRDELALRIAELSTAAASPGDGAEAGGDENARLRAENAELASLVRDARQLDADRADLESILELCVLNQSLGDELDLVRQLTRRGQDEAVAGSDAADDAVEAVEAGQAGAAASSADPAPSRKRGKSRRKK